MEMRAEVVIDAPAEDAWAVVGERFGDIGEWAPSITESVMDGPAAAGRVRTCQVAGFGPIAAGCWRGQKHTSGTAQPDPGWTPGPRR